MNLGFVFFMAKVFKQIRILALNLFWRLLIDKINTLEFQFSMWILSIFLVSLHIYHNSRFLYSKVEIYPAVWRKLNSRIISVSKYSETLV